MFEKITDDVFDVGVNDYGIQIFESQYRVPHGMAYNSYVIVDEKIAVIDTVDKRAGDEWLFNLSEVLQDRKPDYLIIQHLEPDHSANIESFLIQYPDTEIIVSKTASNMLPNFVLSPLEKVKAVGEGDKLSLGKHELVFAMAPMVHWPEVMVTYDVQDKILFSADAFGKFGTKDALEPWDDEARRYYINIVGKFGVQAQALLKKAGALDIAIICPLHGPVLKEDLGHYIGKYQLWSSYTPEIDGVFIPVASIHGHLNKVAMILADMLRKNGCEQVQILDLTRQDVHEAVSLCYAYSKIALVACSYDAGVFPPMERMISILTHKNFQKREIGIVESGSWAPAAARTMKKMLESCKELTLLEPTVTIRTQFKESDRASLQALADALWPKQQD